jgi:YVTN family beta-propeller protein
MGRGGKVLRHSALVAAIVAVFACVAATSAGAAPLLWTVNTPTDSVSTFNTGTNEIVGSSIPVGEGPVSIAITPDGRKALVATNGGERVTAINTATRTATAIPVGEFVEHVAISPDGKTAYVTTAGGEEVFVINIETNAIAGSFPLGPEAEAVAFSPDGTRAYVGTEEGVAVVSTATRKVVAGPIDVGGSPEQIAVSPDGKSVYVVVGTLKSIAVIGTAIGQVVGNIATAAEPTSIAVSPDGRRLYATSETAGTVTVAETATNQVVGSPIVVGGTPAEIALKPDGHVAYVAGNEKVTPIDLTTRNVGTPIATTGAGVAALVVGPDQSPTASFTAPSAVVAFPSLFEGSGSTDPDGTVASYEWAFGDGVIATGPSVSHAYRAPGTYNAQLSVVDNEGCGSEEIFTGRTAYCSGNPLATATHPVEAKPAPDLCTPKFRFGRLIHKRKNGTARLQVRLPSAGSILLFGKKVHAVTRKTKKGGSIFLTIHARVELNKRLKKIHRTSVRIRVTFTPSAGCGYQTVHRSLALLRAPRHKHHR